MMCEKRRYVVRILDEDYTIISDELESHVVTSAQHVNELMTDILNKVPSADTKKIAVLVALRIASDLLHKQARQQESDSKIEACLQKIDQVLV